MAFRFVSRRATALARTGLASKARTKVVPNASSVLASARSLHTHGVLQNARVRLASRFASPDSALQTLNTPMASVLQRRYTSAPSESMTSFSDPERPDLFYHLFEPPTPLSQTAPVFALSFLPDPPQSVQSCTVVGWLPARADAGLNDFHENEAFREVLHEAIRTGLVDGVDDVLVNSALQTQEGWMHIHDNRNIPALGRIGDPDDILGSVRVEDGQILPETYQPMPAYRLCTADGVMQLTQGLATRLRALLDARAAAGR